MKDVAREQEEKASQEDSMRKVFEGEKECMRVSEMECKYEGREGRERLLVGWMVETGVEVS